MLRRYLFLVATLFAFAPALALAGAPQPFDAKAFAAAQAEGKPILLHIEASWCPTCAQQRPILGALEKTPEFTNLVVFNVDFDNQKDVVRKLGVQMQSTLIVYHGKIEKGRSTGETDPAKIKSLLEKAEA